MAEVEETTEIVPIEAAVVGHPEGAVDLKVDKIATEDVAASKGLDATETIPGAISNDADQEGGVKV
jgi:hypothetical protein